jgi:hypothetical protein
MRAMTGKIQITELKARIGELEKSAPTPPADSING